MTFEIQQTDPKSNARAGKITTDHGVIETPIFMPVGTVASVKAVHMHELEEDIKAQIILGNTYHLYLRPGIDILEQVGNFSTNPTAIVKKIFKTKKIQYKPKTPLNKTQNIPIEIDEKKSQKDIIIGGEKNARH